MRRAIRFLGFLLLAVLAFSLAGLPWTIIVGLELWWSPAVGVVVLAISKG